MAQPQMMQIKLSRFDAQPWGFRLQGGTDFAAPLLVQKVNGGSLAETAGLLPGDAVLKINDVDVFNLRHKDAQDVVVRSGNNFVITIQRGGSTWRPQVTPTGHLPQPNQQSPYLQTVTKTSLAHKPQEVHHIGSGYNNSARPFANGGDGSIKSIVNKQYNTPVGIYSEESIAETLSAQAEVLAGGVLGVNFKKNEKEYQAEKSEVLKFLREEETGDHAPVQSHHQYQEPQHHQQQQQHHHQQQQQHHQQQQQQHYQQQQNYQQQQHQQQQYQQPQQQHQQHSQPQQQYHLQQQHQQQSATKHVSAPINSPKPPSTGGLPTGQNICTECERLITGVFVRIKDKNLHVECFKCATCGTSLKNQGYYNFNNKLYCDIHAKLAAMQNPPSGTEGYVPVPIKPNTKLSANTISSALSAHGFANGVSNGNAAPAPAPVNQGYARPFGASPAAAAPKSPVSYPPQQQQQQWGQQQQQQQQQAPKPAVSPYATLPRSNAGQQEACLNNTNNTSSATLPRKPIPSNKTSCNVASKQFEIGGPNITQQQTIDHQNNDQATAMLTDSIGKINMGDKMNNFMSEASKIISNMLEARLANNNGSGTLSHSGSNLSLRSNSSSNLSRSPMVMRKRYELDDFKDVDPTEPVSLKPVVAVSQQVALTPPNGQRLPNKSATQTLTKDMSPNHPMGKVLDLCDKRSQLTAIPKAKPNVISVGQALTSPPPLPATASMPSNHAQDCTSQDSMKPMETVVLRNNSNNKRRAGRGGELSTHAFDRRSYIEPNQPAAVPAPTLVSDESAVFSVSVKPLGRGGADFDENIPMSPENEEVVSQLLKEGKRPICCQCNVEITKGPFITALGRIWCPDHFICVNGNCRRPLQDIGFVEEKGDLYCEYCFEKYLAPTCSNCAGKIKGDCLNAIGKHFHPECFTCGHCGKLFGNTPFFLEEGKAYCEADWNELFTTKCFACGFPVEAGDRWVEALNHNYHSQCFNCTFCKQNLEGQSFYNKGGRPFCKNHAR